jgi:uncharacterized protein with FMN-binding domain/ferredoxin
MEKLTRRSFIGTMGIAATAIPVINVASANASEKEESGAEDAALSAASDEEAFSADMSTLVSYDRDALIRQAKDTPVAEEDLTLPDGTVVDKAYVTLRNRLNRIGEGFGGTPGIKSYDFIQSLWTVEEAEHENEMPLLQWFTASDYAAMSGRDLDEATEILDGLAEKRLIYRTTRAGVDWFYLFGGMWGVRAATKFRDFNKQFIENANTCSGSDGHESQYPILAVCPVSPDVVEGGKIVPYRDWRGVLERNTIFGVAPCGCRNYTILEGAMEENDSYHGILHCVVVGEMAQFMIETNNATQITKEEALDLYDRKVEEGFVPEMYFAENPEVFCLCKSECCACLAAYRAVDGHTNKFPNVSAYTLSYDKDACIQCGACIDRCPMKSVSFGDDGYCVMDDACIGCGQCALVCPADARILKLKENVPEMPFDLLDGMAWCAADRQATGGTIDFIGSELPEEAIESSQAAIDAMPDFNYLIDQKPSGGADSYEDGNYEASVLSIGGQMTVNVEISGGKITSVNVVEDNDTPDIGEAAFGMLADQIVEANGLDVDVITTATHSSIALLRAVQDCLRQAGWDGGNQ